MDIPSLGELGVATLGLIIAILALDMVRKKFRQSTNGNRRQNLDPLVVNCPNNLPGLQAALISLDKSTRALEKLAIEEVKLLQHNGDGIDILVDQHKAVNGRETWKMSSRTESLLESTCAAVKDLVREIKRNGRS